MPTRNPQRRNQTRRSALYRQAATDAWESSFEEKRYLVQLRPGRSAIGKLDGQQIRLAFASSTARTVKMVETEIERLFAGTGGFAFDWQSDAKYIAFHVPYREMVNQLMVEVVKASIYIQILAFISGLIK